MLIISFSYAALDKKEYTTQKTKLPINIDGNIDEDSWKTAEWHKDFQMYYPYDNKKASQETKFAILYDDDFVYVAVKAMDSNPEKLLSD